MVPEVTEQQRISIPQDEHKMSVLTQVIPNVPWGHNRNPKLQWFETWLQYLTWPTILSHRSGQLNQLPLVSPTIRMFICHWALGPRPFLDRTHPWNSCCVRVLRNTSRPWYLLMEVLKQWQQPPMWKNITVSQEGLDQCLLCLALSWIKLVQF